ncbi:hypothetical protein [Pseudomonas phage D6]|nr:hypothetical protein [Pseudomonas phage D6]
MSFVSFLTASQPKFQSYFPGGINYDLTKPMEHRIKLVHSMTFALLQEAKSLDVTHVGRTGKKHKRYTAISLLQRYLEHGTFREDRKAWKNICKTQKVWSAVEEWAVGETPDDKKLWEEFRVALKAFVVGHANRVKQSSKMKTLADAPEPEPKVPNECWLRHFEKHSQNPEYLHFINVQFPEWMSLTPGGQNYRMDVYDTIEERVRRWESATAELVAIAIRLGIRIDGGPGITKISPDNQRAVRYSVATQLRKIRNGWKKVMKHLELKYDDTMWRLPNARTGVWTEEWVEFHAVTKELFWNGKSTW